MKKINLNYYELFYRVAKNGSIPKTSKENFISQPAITEQLNKLENQLGTKLLIRTKKGVVLTDTGKLIFDDIQNGIENFENASSKIDNFLENVSGKISIGAGTSLCKYFLTEKIINFSKKYPNVNFEIIDKKSDSALKLVKDGTLNFCITDQSQIRETLGIDSQPLFNISYVLIFSKNLVKKIDISLKELLKIPIIAQEKGTNTRENFDKLCKLYNIENLNIKFLVAGYTTIIDMVENGIGISFVPKYTIRNNDKISFLESPAISCDKYCIAYKNENLSVAGQKFM